MKYNYLLNGIVRLMHNRISIIFLYLVVSLNTYSQFNNSNLTLNQIQTKYPDAKELTLYFKSISSEKVSDLNNALTKFPGRIIQYYFDETFNTINIIYSNGLEVIEIYEIINRIEPDFLRLTAKPEDEENLEEFVRENNIEKKL